MSKRIGAVMTFKLWFWERFDTLLHFLWDPYINAEVRGHHLPGWGYLQLWQHNVCTIYERKWDMADEKDQEKARSKRDKKT